MADPLYELLAPYFDHEAEPPSARDPQTTGYLSRLSTLSFADLTASESASLLQSAQSHLRNLQALSKRSHKAVLSSSSHLANLSSILPEFGVLAQALSKDVPKLESAAANFAQKYDRSTENAVLDRRKRAALLSRNVDRVSDVLDLPSLLSSTVTAAQAGSAGTFAAIGSTTSYSSALDLHAHVKRLKALYPNSELVDNIHTQSEAEMRNLATILITSLQSPQLKLAAAMRTVGWLRRVAPDLVAEEQNVQKAGALSMNSLSISTRTASSEGALGLLFLVSRLRTLHETLDALEPLRDLADQESAQRKSSPTSHGKTAKPTSSAPVSAGTQSERFLKRYIEIFREQSFNALSMYKSIFPTNLPEAGNVESEENGKGQRAAEDPLLPLPSPVCSFGIHLVDMLEAVLRNYLPNIVDKSSRESLLTQVLYCAGSLGRLGADFGMMIAVLEDDLNETEDEVEDEMEMSTEKAEKVAFTEESEWAQVMKKHRIQASRLEVLARGVGTSRKGGTAGEVLSPSATSPMPLSAS